MNVAHRHRHRRTRASTAPSSSPANCSAAPSSARRGPPRSPAARASTSPASSSPAAATPSRSCPATTRRPGPARPGRPRGIPTASAADRRAAPLERHRHRADRHHHEAQRARPLARRTPRRPRRPVADTAARPPPAPPPAGSSSPGRCRRPPRRRARRARPSRPCRATATTSGSPSTRPARRSPRCCSPANGSTWSSRTPRSSPRSSAATRTSTSATSTPRWPRRSALRRRNVGTVLLTLGSAGAVLVSDEGAFAAAAPRIVARSTVGAGDSSLAGYLLAEVAGASPEQRLAQAVATGAAAAALPGSDVPALDHTDPTAISVRCSTRTRHPTRLILPHPADHPTNTCTTARPAPLRRSKHMSATRVRASSAPSSSASTRTSAPPSTDVIRVARRPRRRDRPRRRRRHLADDAIKREASVGTGVPGGIAIPHARSASVSEPTLAFSRLARKVSFGAPDGDADIVFMIAVPEGADKDHLTVLSTLARALIRDDFTAALRAATTPDEIVQLVDREVSGEVAEAGVGKASSASSPAHRAARRRPQGLRRRHRLPDRHRAHLHGGRRPRRRGPARRRRDARRDPGLLAGRAPRPRADRPRRRRRLRGRRRRPRPRSLRRQAARLRPRQARRRRARQDDRRGHPRLGGPERRTRAGRCRRRGPRRPRRTSTSGRRSSAGCSPASAT